MLEDVKASGKIYDEINPFMNSMNYTRIRSIPSISVWAPANSRLPSTIYNGIAEQPGFEKKFGLMMQKDWLDDCLD